MFLVLVQVMLEVQLKSEYDAIQQWAIAKKCPSVIPPADHPPEFDPNLVKEFGR